MINCRGEYKRRRRVRILPCKVDIRREVGVVPGGVWVDYVESERPFKDVIVSERDVVGGVSAELLELLCQDRRCRHGVL